MAATSESLSTQADASTWSGTVTAANPARDGSGTLTVIHTAPADGSFLYGLRFSSMGLNEASLANVFIDDGVSKFLETQVALPAITPSETEPDPVVYVPIGKKIKAGHVISFALCRAVYSGWRAKAVADGFTAVV